MRYAQTFHTAELYSAPSYSWGGEVIAVGCAQVAEQESSNEATASQSHGFKFEQLILDTKKLTPPSGATHFDAPYGAFEKGTALSIKVTVNSKTIEMGDACRIRGLGQLLRDLDEEHGDGAFFRLIVGEYEQEGCHKVIRRVHDLTLNFADPVVEASLFGKLTTEDLSSIHNGLKKEMRPCLEQARAFASRKAAKLVSGTGAMQLNPKISETNRRLQCSFALQDLIAVACDYSLHTEDVEGLPLPLSLAGGPRKLKSKQAVAKRDVSPLQTVPINAVQLAARASYCLAGAFS